MAESSFDVDAIQKIQADDRTALMSGEVDRIEHAVISFDGVIARWHSERYRGTRLISVSDASPATEDRANVTPMALISRSVEPSIYAGRSQQYTVDPPSSGHYLDSGAGCWGETGSTTIYYPGVDTVTWKISSSFGGHIFKRHTGAEPTIRLDWKGNNPLKAGANVPPADENKQTAVTILTANDSATYHRSGISLMRAYLPEVAEEVQLEETLACSNTNIAIPLKGTLRVEMNVALQSVADIVSDNRATRLTIQGLGNSHPFSAGYATAATVSQLRQLVESYSTCLDRPARGLYPLRSEALSLVNGGLYDINDDWKGTSGGSHKNHRAGEDADIGLSGLKQVDLNCLYSAYNENAFQSPVIGERLVLDKNGNAYAPPYSNGDKATHVHLWSGSTHFYPEDENAQLSTAIKHCDQQDRSCSKEIGQ